MPNWRKVITSGSDANLNKLVVDTDITASGNVGIGATSTDHRLFVSGSEQCLSVFKSSTNGAGVVFMDNGTTDDFSVGLGAFNDHLCFLAGGTQQMRLLDNGNLGIGTITPSATLHVIGTVSASKFETEGQISASLFSGSFVGDGSGLTGIPAGGSGIFAATGSVQSTTNNLQITGSLEIYKSGSTVFNIEGSQGTLFTVTDELSGSLFSVNDISGIPIFEVFSDDTVKIGTFNAEELVITDGMVILSQVSESLDFPDDTEAAAGGVPLGGLYHNSGSVRIRLT